MNFIRDSLVVCTAAAVIATGAAAQETITVWTQNYPEGSIENLGALFEERHPDIDVEIISYPWSDSEWNLRLTTSMAANDLPDVIIAPQVAISWGLKGFLQPVTDLAQRDGIDMDTWSSSSQDLSVFNEEVYALPFSGSAMLLYYNRDHLEEAGIDPKDPPKDWAELLEYSEKLTRYQENGDLERVGYVADFGGATRLTLYMYGNGGGFFNRDCSAPRLNDPKNVEALEWYVGTYDALGGAEEVLAFLEGVGGDANAAFYSGRVSLYPKQNDLASTIAQNAPDLNWGVWPHPSNTGEPPITLSGINQVSMGAGTEHREAAWEFMKFAVTDRDAAVQFVRDSNYLSLLPGIASDFSDIPAIALASELIEGETRPWNPNPLADSTVYVERSSATDIALRHTATALEALDQANRNLTDAYNQQLQDLADQGVEGFVLSCS